MTVLHNQVTLTPPFALWAQTSCLAQHTDISAVPSSTKAKACCGLPTLQALPGLAEMQHYDLAHLLAIVLACHIWDACDCLLQGDPNLLQPSSLGQQ